MKDGLSPCIDSFLAMISVEKGLAQNTVEAYSRDLSRLADFMVRRNVASWAEVQTIHLRSYVSWLRRLGLSIRSIARHIVALRRFYRFLQTEGVITEDPLPALYLKPVSRKLPHTLSADDVRRLLVQPRATHALGMRDQAMLELLYATGLRVSELVSLQLQQLNLQGNYLT